MAGEVTPRQVADAVWSAIVKDRGEVDVVPVGLRASLRMQSLAPSLFANVARSTGASAASDELSERQRHKR
jgi:hypothetical protein